MGVKIRDLENDGRAWLVIHHAGKRSTKLIGRPPAGVAIEEWEPAKRKAAQAERLLELTPDRGEITFRE